MVPVALGAQQLKIESGNLDRFDLVASLACALRVGLRQGMAEVGTLPSGCPWVIGMRRTIELDAFSVVQWDITVISRPCDCRSSKCSDVHRVASDTCDALRRRGKASRTAIADSRDESHATRTRSPIGDACGSTRACCRCLPQDTSTRELRAQAIAHLSVPRAPKVGWAGHRRSADLPAQGSPNRSHAPT